MNFDSSSQYTKSTEKERFERQLARDLERSSNKAKQKRGEDPKLSPSVISKIKDDTALWARDIASQKLSQVNAGNYSAMQAMPNHSFNQFSGGGSINSDISGGMGPVNESTNASTSGDMPFLAPPEGSGLFVLGSLGGEIQWIPTQDCN